MAIRSLGPGKWVIDVYPAGGKGQRTRQTFSGSYEDAIGLEQELLLGPEGGPYPSHSPTVAQLIPDYFAWATLHLAAATVSDLTRSFRTLKPHFGPRPFLKLTTADVERYKQLRTDAGRRRIFRSVNKELAYLRSLIKWAVTVKGLPRPRALFSPLPYTRPLPKIPRPETVERLLAAITPRSRHVERKRAAVLLMWECGLRWNETRHLRWEDLDLEGHHAIVRKPKGPRQRRVPLTERIVALLRPFQRPEGWIFENAHTGRPWVSLKDLFRNAADRAQIDRMGRHVLRHAWATDTLEAGGDVRTVQAILGHADIRQTQWYTQISPQSMAATAAQTVAYRVNQSRTSHNGPSTDEQTPPKPLKRKAGGRD